MKEKTIDLLERTLLTHALISSIHFREPLPALQKLNAEIEQHIRELKDIPSDPSETSDLSDPSESEGSMDELKPCPFCGEKPLMVHSALNEYHSVESQIGCSHCRYIIQAPDWAIDMDKSVKENCDFEDSQTISYWNTRPAEDALKAEIEKLKAALKRIAYYRDLNPDMKANRFSSCAEDDLRNFYCTMGDIAIQALGTDTDVPAKESEEQSK